MQWTRGAVGALKNLLTQSGESSSYPEQGHLSSSLLGMGSHGSPFVLEFLICRVGRLFFSLEISIRDGKMQLSGAQHKVGD